MNTWNDWKEKQQRCEIYYSKPLDDTYQYWNQILTDEFSKFCFIDGTLLDVGCGNPDRSLKYFSGNYIYGGLDPNIENPKTKLPLIRGVSEFLPLRTGIIDNIALISLLDHIVDPILCMKEAKRVLRQGGTLWILLLIWMKHFSLERDEYHLKHFSIDDLMGMLLDFQYQRSLSIPYKEDFRRVLFLKLKRGNGC